MKTVQGSWGPKDRSPEVGGRQDGLGLMGIGLTMKGASCRVSIFEFRVSCFH